MLNIIMQYKDDAYAVLLRNLLPTVPPEKVIGVRTPQLKALAKLMLKDGMAETFISELPHTYFEENQLHAFILSEYRDFQTCIAETQRFLPCIDNWATCDQFSPKAFSKSKELLLPYVEAWLASPLPYTVRFGIGTLMRHFLDEAFKPEYPYKVASVRSDEYYVNMMIAWYFATALAKQYDQVVPLIEQKILPKWTHNKAIQKARESYRISPERKEYLNTLKIK